MSDIIHLLPDHIANQIAAGEVIQRPASVVKELMENAVDAEATEIIVNIKDAGRTLVQVTDNGKGMSETDARMAFERHATSKISDAKDLYALRTMGFRGEALASIAAVAQVELRTRARDAELGTRLSICGSVLESIEADACIQGAIFSIKNLFYNVPVRRKFLKSNETEFRNIMTEFERVALVHPPIAFKLYHNDTEVMNLPASGLRQRIVNVFGKSFSPKLLPLESATSLVKIEGFIGRTDTVRRRGYQNYFFVNGRYMRHPYFHKAVMHAYEPLIPASEYPDYFIYITLDPSEIDVNIHPTKTEIKFENEQPIWQILSSAVREALGKSNSVPSINFDTEGAIDIPTYNPSMQGRVRPPVVQIDTKYNPFQTSHRPSYPERNWEMLYQDFEKGRKDTSEEMGLSSDISSREPKPESLFPDVSSPCFQYKNRYIITSLKSGLVLIDQHRAHVRVLYNQYIRNVKQQKGVSQQMLFPELVELTPVEAALIPSLTDDLHRLGFDLNPMGNNSYSITALPAGVEENNPAELLKDLVHSAAELCGALGDEIAETLALLAGSIGCHTSGKTAHRRRNGSDDGRPVLVRIESPDSRWKTHPLYPDG